MDSEAPFEYTSAVSNRFTPASRQMSTMRRAPATSVLPQALNSGPLPAEGAGAEAERRHLEAGAAEKAMFHDEFLVEWMR